MKFYLGTSHNIPLPTALISIHVPNLFHWTKQPMICGLDLHQLRGVNITLQTI